MPPGPPSSPSLPPSSPSLPPGSSSSSSLTNVTLLPPPGPSRKTRTVRPMPKLSLSDGQKFLDQLKLETSQRPKRPPSNTNNVKNTNIEKISITRFR